MENIITDVDNGKNNFLKDILNIQYISNENNYISLNSELLLKSIIENYNGNYYSKLENKTYPSKFVLSDLKGIKNIGELHKIIESDFDRSCNEEIIKSTSYSKQSLYIKSFKTFLDSLNGKGIGVLNSLIKNNKHLVNSIVI